MQYMLLIHLPEDGPARAPETAKAMSPEYAAYTEAMAKAGVNLGGDRLLPSSQAASLRIRNGKTEVLDGPYADTREHLAGYYLIDVKDRQEAIEWAEKCPSAKMGSIELRPVVAETKSW